MDTDQLLNLATEAFDAIERNVGKRYWTRADGLAKAIEAFNLANCDLGLAGLIDAATGSGMSHMGLMYWLDEAKRITGEAA